MISLFLPVGAKNCAAQVSLAWDAVTTNADGSPCTDLAGYKIYFGTASGQYRSSRDVGNVVTYRLTDLSAGTTYFIATTAYDTSGMETGYSNEVVYNVAPACTYSILPASQPFDSSGGSGQANLTTQATCAWTAVSNAPSWLLLTSNSSGSGNTTVYYTASTNTGTGSRTGSLAIAGLTFTVSQSGVACAYSLSSSSQSFSSSAVTGAVSVTASGGCSWTATNNASWITVTSGSSGSGNGTTSYSVSANSSTSSRTGTLTIAGQTFTVNQAGSACAYSLPSSSRSFRSSARTGSVSITAGDGCSWTAASNAGWITVISGSSGSGNGTTSYSVSANSSSSSRTGTLTIAGQTFTVNQAGRWR